MRLETIELLGAILGLAESLEVRSLDFSHYHLGGLSKRIRAVRLSAESFLQVFPEPDRACFDDYFDELFVILTSGVKVWALVESQAYPHLPRTVKGGRIVANHTPGPWKARMNCDVMSGDRRVADCMTGRLSKLREAFSEAGLTDYL